MCVWLWNDLIGLYVVLIGFSFSLELVCNIFQGSAAITVPFCFHWNRNGIRYLDLHCFVCSVHGLNMQTLVTLWLTSGLATPVTSWPSLINFPLHLGIGISPSLVTFFLEEKKCSCSSGWHTKSIWICPSIFLANLEEELSLEYKTILKQEELYRFQKSKSKWFIEGERNNWFFHTSAVVKQRKRTVTMLQDMSGN